MEKQAKYRSEFSFGIQRFRGTVVWVDERGVRQRVICDHTRRHRTEALDDAHSLLAVLRSSEKTNQKFG